jgi:hypothetical protein
MMAGADQSNNCVQPPFAECSPRHDTTVGQRSLTVLHIDFDQPCARRGQRPDLLPLTGHGRRTRPGASCSLEAENARFTRIVADRALDIPMLTELALGEF